MARLRCRSCLAGSLLLLALATDVRAQTSPVPAAPVAPVPGAVTPPVAMPPVVTPPAEPAAAQPVVARPLRLEEALRDALAHQPSLAQAHAAVALAEAESDRALAPLLPQVGAVASYQRAGGSSRRGLVTSGVTPGGQLATSSGSYDFYSAGVTLDQLIFDFDQTHGRWQAAQMALESQRASERDARLGLGLDVKTAYYQAIAQRALLGVARETLANRERHVAETEGFVEVGTRPPIDRVQAQADRESDRLALVNAENGYALAKARLLQAMGREQPLDFDVVPEAEPAVPGEDAPGGELLRRALAARPDVQAALDGIEQSRIQRGAARGGYGPSLSASASATEAGGALDALRFGWSAGATLSWPLFQGGLTRADVAAAQAGLDAARAQLDSLRQQILLAIEQARLGVRAARQSLQNAERLGELSRERLTLAEGQYQTGVGTMLALSDAQVALSTALAQRVQAEYDLSLARAELRRALGQ